MTLSVFNLHADAEAFLGMIETRGWQVYLRHLAAKRDAALDRMRTCSREELPENRAKWVAAVDSMSIPQQVIEQARRERQKLEA